MELESLAIKIARSENLPVLPQVVSSVLRIADGPNASARAMEQVIERDPAIAAKVLRVANSSFYGCSRVPTIGRALSVLGLNTIRSLVVGVVFQQMAAGRGRQSFFKMLAFWQHSLAVATGARILAKIRLPARAEEAYGAGMLHDVGMLVLDRFCPKEFDEAIALADRESCPLHEAERRSYGFDHGDVGALLAEKWSLPPMLHSAIAHHHRAQSAAGTDLTCIVAAADVLAHQCGLGNQSGGALYEIDPVVEETLNLPLEQLALIGKLMYDEVTRAQAAFQIAA